MLLLFRRKISSEPPREIVRLRAESSQSDVGRRLEQRQRNAGDCDDYSFAQS